MLRRGDRIGLCSGRWTRVVGRDGCRCRLVWCGSGRIRLGYGRILCRVVPRVIVVVGLRGRGPFVFCPVVLRGCGVRCLTAWCRGR